MHISCILINISVQTRSVIQKSKMEYIHGSIMILFVHGSLYKCCNKFMAALIYMFGHKLWVSHPYLCVANLLRFIRESRVIEGKQSLHVYAN